MSCIKFFNNFVFDKDNDSFEAVFIDTRRNRTIIFENISKADVIKVFSQRYEEISSFELVRVARTLLKNGIAYLSDSDFSEDIFTDNLEDRLFEQKMMSWWKTTRETAFLNQNGNGLTKVCLGTAS